MRNIIAVILCLTGSMFAQYAAPSIVASGAPSSQNFMKYTLSHVDAVLLRYNWSQLETTPNVFNFKQVDSDVAKWAALGKKSVVLGAIVSDTPNLNGNSATPIWLLNMKVPVVTCKYVPQGIPVVYDKTFMQYSQAFIIALLKHLDGNKNILYVRVGFFEGGENCPLCTSSLPNYSEQTVITYVQQMVAAIVAGHQIIGIKNPTRFVSNCNGCQGDAYADQEAAVFSATNIGIGMEALSATDKTAYDAGKICADDWCNLFNKYPSDYLYLQPAVDQPVTAFPIYVKFSKLFSTDALELFPSDLDIAYDPNNPQYAKYGASYRAVLPH